MIVISVLVAASAKVDVVGTGELGKSEEPIPDLDEDDSRDDRKVDSKVGSEDVPLNRTDLTSWSFQEMTRISSWM